MSLFNKKMADAWARKNRSQNNSSFGEKMAALWANKKKVPRRVCNPATTSVIVGNIAAGRNINYNNIKNDEQSKAYIEQYLKKKGLTHKPTFDNLVFDYLNTPVDIRDEVIEQNINQVKDQLEVRMDQIQEQQKLGYASGSLDTVDNYQSHGDQMEAGSVTIRRTLLERGIRTRVDIRDEAIEQNINQVKDQLEVRMDQIQEQQKLGYASGSLNRVDDYQLHGDQMEAGSVRTIRNVIQHGVAPTLASGSEVILDRIETQQQRVSATRSLFSVEENKSFGERMAALWANKKKVPRRVCNPATTSVIVGNIAAGRNINYNNIKNDEQSKAYIEQYLKKKGLTHKPTFDNLVFDYLNTPVDIRDEVIEQNINQVKDQLEVRMDQIQEQQKLGYASGSLDTVDNYQSHGDQMEAGSVRTIRNVIQHSLRASAGASSESSVDQIEIEGVTGNVHDIFTVADRNESNGYLESLEKRVSVLERRLKIQPTTMQRDGRLERLEKRIINLEKMYA